MRSRRKKRRKRSITDSVRNRNAYKREKTHDNIKFDVRKKQNEIVGNLLLKKANEEPGNRPRKKFIVTCLRILNSIRKKYGVPNLRWNHGLYLLAKQNISGDGFGRLSGEFEDTICSNSISWFGGNLNEENTLVDSIKSWYESRKNYSYDDPYLNDFAKIVWKTTTDVAFFIDKTDGGLKVLSYYFPKGDLAKNHRENIPREVHERDPFIEEKKRDEKLKEEKEKKMYSGIPEVEKAWKKMTLDVHNKLRARHGCPPLHWSERCYRFSSHWARTLAKERGFHHSKHSDFGENLYTSTGRVSKDNILSCGRDAIESWYNEIDMYDFSNPGFGFGTGHFTQVIWKSTTLVGMGFGINGSTIVVSANYMPHGNFMGRFKENVLPLIDRSYELPPPPNNESETTRRKRMELQRKLRENKRNKDYFLRMKNDRLLKRVRPANRIWVNTILKLTNKYRAMHGSPPVKWSHSLYAKAKLHCDGGKMKFLGVNELSEIVLGVFGDFQDETKKLAKYCIDSFYEKHKYHNFENHIGGDQFMNLVCRRSKFIGMSSSKDGEVVSCFLFPPLCDEKNNVFKKGTKVSIYREANPKIVPDFTEEEEEEGEEEEEVVGNIGTGKKLSFDQYLQMSKGENIVNSDTTHQEEDDKEEKDRVTTTTTTTSIIEEEEEEDDDDEDQDIQSLLREAKELNNALEKIDTEKSEKVRRNEEQIKNKKNADPIFPPIYSRNNSFRKKKNNPSSKTSQRNRNNNNDQKQIFHHRRVSRNRKTSSSTRNNRSSGRINRIQRMNPEEVEVSSFLKPETMTGYAKRDIDFKKLKQGWVKKCVVTHNRIRKNHSTSPIIWSEDLCTHAVEWSLKLAKDNTLNLSEDRHMKNLGENIYFYKLGEKEKLPHELQRNESSSSSSSSAKNGRRNQKFVRRKKKRTRIDTGLRRRRIMKRKTGSNLLPKFYEDLVDRVLVKNWYENELVKYNFSQPGNRLDTVHFSQVVWKSTALFGMGMAVNRVTRVVVVVANYTPSGNITGEFRQSVMPKLSPEILRKMEEEEKRKKKMEMNSRRRRRMKKKNRRSKGRYNYRRGGGVSNSGAKKRV